MYMAQIPKFYSMGYLYRCTPTPHGFLAPATCGHYCLIQYCLVLDPLILYSTTPLFMLCLHSSPYLSAGARFPTASPATEACSASVALAGVWHTASSHLGLTGAAAEITLIPAAAASVEGDGGLCHILRSQLQTHVKLLHRGQRETLLWRACMRSFRGIL